MANYSAISHYFVAVCLRASRTIFVTQMMAIVLFRALEIARGAPPLFSAKSADGFLFFVGLTAVVGAPYFMGTGVARLLWPLRIGLYRTYRPQ